jgi:TetR/AcrR family transcriptional regulator, fatty acid metabolism regulator protein
MGDGARRSSRAQPSPVAAERGGARDERRKQILKAAVQVFAEKGYHGCRISDVAERAGTAYGLVYHYFGNKEGLLASIFETNWSVFAKALEDVAEQESTTQDKVRQMVQFLLNAFEVNPLLVKVLVLEFGRSSRLGDPLDDPHVNRVFSSVQRIFREGAEKGELSPGLDPRALTVVFLGALEAALASFVIPSPGDAASPAQPTSYEAMRETLMHIVSRGFFLQKGKTPEKRGGRKARP